MTMSSSVDSIVRVYLTLHRLDYRREAEAPTRYACFISSCGPEMGGQSSDEPIALNPSHTITRLHVRLSYNDIAAFAETKRHPDTRHHASRGLSPVPAFDRSIFWGNYRQRCHDCRDNLLSTAKPQISPMP